MTAGYSLRKAHFVESVLSCLSGQQGVVAMPMEPPEGRKVKSGPADAVEATDQHERAKDYLSPAEMARLLDAEGRPARGARPPSAADDLPPRPARQRGRGPAPGRARPRPRPAVGRRLKGDLSA